jgi:hypothetical protein
MNTNIKAGLVFSIPLVNKAFGFGHLLARQAPIFYMVAYDIQSETPDVDDDSIRRAKPVLMGNFFDVLIRNGRWAPVRHFARPVVPYPCVKIRIGDIFYIESWDRRRKREARQEELLQVEFRANHGPIILEQALNAHFKLVLWESMFEPLRADAVLAVSKLC